jgi:CheY-like chemotaxis protein
MPTVLVVDDEPYVRELTARMLRLAGYETVEAPDGRAAWSFLHRAGIPVDALVCDVVMPGMTGTELAALLREARPTFPVLLMSGYTADAMVARGLEQYSGPLLTKPFTHEALLALVAQLFNKPGQSSVAG